MRNIYVEGLKRAYYPTRLLAFYVTFWEFVDVVEMLDFYEPGIQPSAVKGFPRSMARLSLIALG